MKKQSKNNNCTNSLVSEPSETDVNNNQLENEEVLQNITIDQVADELNRISQLDTILDNYFENHTSDDLNNELNYNEPEDLLEINITEAESFIKKTEIDYIINNPRSNISQESVDYEPEEKIFRDNGSCDVFLMLELRESHKAFSRSDRPRGIRTQIAVNLNQGSQDGINRNLANHLVNQLSNNQNCQVIRSRTQRWKGRNQLQSLVNSNKTQGNNI